MRRSKSARDPEQLAPIIMRPGLHSKGPNTISEDAYSPLPHEIANVGPAYPAFPHGDPVVEHNTPTFNVSSPPEEHAGPSHVDHSGLHVDPNLSSEVNRHLHGPPHSLAVHHDSQDFTEPSTPSESTAIAAVPPPIPPNTAPPGQFDMIPPLTSTHPTWQALHTYAQAHASAHGYALSINTTAKNRSRIKLACVCYGAPKNTHKLTSETRVRKNRVSNKTGCKMWIEGKKNEHGIWILRVGESAHNHEGRASQGWAVQRKRTWGVEGGRVGTGGVTALEEREQQRMGNVDRRQSNQPEDTQSEDHLATPDAYDPHKATHSLERGGLVWKIVEQEMLRKGSRIQIQGQGSRDRGVGRTVQILEERLPGIHIFKRDVYNIRAQIKRARKLAGQEIGDNIVLSDDDGDGEDHRSDVEGYTKHRHHEYPSTSHENIQDRGGFAQIDPTLIAQCNSALETVSQRDEKDAEIEQLRREVSGLRHALTLRTKEVEEKNDEIESLKLQLEIAGVGHSGKA